MKLSSIGCTQHVYVREEGWKVIPRDVIDGRMRHHLALTSLGARGVRNGRATSALFEPFLLLFLQSCCQRDCVPVFATICTAALRTCSHVHRVLTSCFNIHSTFHSAVIRKKKKRTSVSHSSTEAEIISLDAGLRMDGVLALDLWDVAIEVLRSTNSSHFSNFFLIQPES